MSGDHAKREIVTGDKPASPGRTHSREFGHNRAGNEPSSAQLGSPILQAGERGSARRWLASHTLIYIIALSSELLVYKYKYIDIIHHYE
jgi:hypothetical protein